MKRKNLKSDNEVFEAMLKEACKDAAEEMFAEYYDVTDADDFSDEHKQKMKNLFKKAEQKDKLLKLIKFSKYAVCVILVFTIFSGITIMSVESVRNKFLHYFFDKDAAYTEIDSGVHAPVYLGDYVINYIPAGYTLSEKGEYHVIFENDKLQISIIISESDSKVRIDTEDAEVKDLEINEYDALFSRKDNGNVLLLSDGKNNIRIIGDTDEQTMIEIAKNIKYEY